MERGRRRVIIPENTAKEIKANYTIKILLSVLAVKSKGTQNSVALLI